MDDTRGYALSSRGHQVHSLTVINTPPRFVGQVLRIKGRSTKFYARQSPKRLLNWFSSANRSRSLPWRSIRDDCQNPANFDYLYVCYFKYKIKHQKWLTSRGIICFNWLFPVKNICTSKIEWNRRVDDFYRQSWQPSPTTDHDQGLIKGPILLLLSKQAFRKYQLSLTSLPQTLHMQYQLQSINGLEEWQMAVVGGGSGGAVQ